MHLRIPMPRPDEGTDRSQNMYVKLFSFIVSESAPEYVKSLIAEQRALSAKQNYRRGHTALAMAVPASLRSDFDRFVDCKFATWTRTLVGTYGSFDGDLGEIALQSSQYHKELHRAGASYKERVKDQMEFNLR